ncbi:hypothetical protein BHE74_00018917 [Ensete ventricosum]|nr:hypothetical protein BHE74_00018917 [Ensete ventricosum]
MYAISMIHRPLSLITDPLSRPTLSVLSTLEKVPHEPFPGRNRRNQWACDVKRSNTDGGFRGDPFSLHCSGGTPQGAVPRCAPFPTHSAHAPSANGGLLRCAREAMLPCFGWVEGAIAAPTPSDDDSTSHLRLGCGSPGILDGVGISVKDGNKDCGNEGQASRSIGSAVSRLRGYSSSAASFGGTRRRNPRSRPRERLENEAAAAVEPSWRRLLSTPTVEADRTMVETEASGCEEEVECSKYDGLHVPHHVTRRAPCQHSFWHKGAVHAMGIANT